MCNESFFEKQTTLTLKFIVTAKLSIVESASLQFVEVTTLTMESRNLLILYGSETGCAQDTAERIGRQARRRHFRTRVMAMDEYDKVRQQPRLHSVT